ncbi:MAG: c-type cytochrome biogenesis protein CcmI [Roseovarius sp.]
MIFWVFAIALGLACAAILGLVLMRGRVGDAPPAAYDLQVYRDQLREVDRDLARGVITPEDAERTRAEVSRRILAADAQLQATGTAGAQPALPGKALAGLALAGIVAGAALLYAQMGMPGYGDLPRAARLAASEAARANRLSQAAAEARADAATPDTGAEAPDPQYLDLMQRLREAVRSRPDEIQGYILLARNEAALGNLAAAHAAKAEVIRLKGDDATARDYAELADMMISAAGGYVSSQAEQALRDALSRDPSEPRARYYMGLYMLQVDRPDAAFRTWDALLRDSPADAPWTALIRPRIEDLAWRAGIPRYRPPEPGAAPPGPSQGDIDAAGEMSAEDRAAMIRGMVDRLAARIEETGGTEGEWVRLSNAYAVLGDFDAVRDLIARAQDRFDDPEVIDTITNAAKQAGFSE